MRKIFISLFMFVCFGVSAQEVTMRDVFKQMPDSLIPYLSSNNRLDFIDFIDSKMDAEVANSLGGKSRMQKLTDKYVSLALNEAASLEMMLLPVSEPVDSTSQIICMIRTYGKDIRESTVDFYSMKWRLLKTSDYLTPATDMFVATLNEETSTMTLTPEVKLDTPANEEQKELVKTSITLKWNNGFVNGY